MIRPLLAAAAVLAVAAPSAAAHGGGAPDAEIFATNNTAIITDSDDPRLDDRLRDVVELILPAGDATVVHARAPVRRIGGVSGPDGEVCGAVAVHREPVR